MSCLFCRIVAGEVPAKRVYEDEQVLAFDDVQPHAPMHVLVVPKKHISTLNDLGPDDDAVIGAVVRGGAAAARERGYAEKGYRTVFNCGSDAGQSIFHIHLHVIGGRALSWPPG